MIRTALCLLGLLVLPFAACNTSTLGSRPVICASANYGGHLSATQIPKDDWLSLLVDDQGYRRDCTGRDFLPVELPLRCAVSAQPGQPRDLPLRSAQVDVYQAFGDFALLWLPVERYADEHQGGLVGLVHVSEETLSLVGLGMVRLPAEQVSLELRKVRGDDVLFARGTSCPGQSARGSCEQVLELLLLHEGRFVPLELRDEQNQCVGSMRVPLELSQDMRLDSETVRRFGLTATYELHEDGLIINEQLLTTDRPVASDEENARLFRKSDGTRELRYTGAYFVTDRESLWAGMREARGTLIRDDLRRPYR